MRKRNLEQKFVCGDIKMIVERCRANRYKVHSHGRQEDLYFVSKKGRLKIRFADNAAELIYYLRRNSIKPRISDYHRLPLGRSRDEIAYVLRAALGIIGSVRKERTVYYNKRIRINIDRVVGLGDFVELEAEFGKGGSAAALRFLEATKTALGLANERAIACSYIDLISRKSPPQPDKPRRRGVSRKT
jgi:predicted adenylyl cyclase CyaB